MTKKQFLISALPLRPTTGFINGVLLCCATPFRLVYFPQHTGMAIDISANRLNDYPLFHFL
ncbi:hypothetical protein ACTHGU_07515 [Chitinophagaceae bacterium MMS25-I14]